jgi:hypothetical protein
MEKATRVSFGCQAAPRGVLFPRHGASKLLPLRLHCFFARSLLLFVLRLNLSASLFDLPSIRFEAAEMKNGAKLG